MAAHATKVTASDLSPEMTAAVAAEAVARGLANVETITTPDRCSAIRTLQGLASREVAAHFEIEADGSFTIDTIVIEAI